MSPSSELASGTCLVAGRATGELLVSDVPLSFMGGVDPSTGRVVDAHHPLHGAVVTGKVLAIPGGRGSCAGSGVILEMLVAGTAPAALVFCQDEAILTVGVVIAGQVVDRSMPVVRLAPSDFASLRERPGQVRVHVERATTPSVRLGAGDRAMLAGQHGRAARVAMQVVVQAAELLGAQDLVDVTRAHVDGVFYQGAGSLAFATTLRDLGARVRVPTTANALCVDRRRWRPQGVSDAVGAPSEVLAQTYEDMGVAPTWTCAPYCLRDRPRAGEQIAWAESNAVVYANTVLGARTLKYPDYLDLLVAITGRAPLAGPHLDAGRVATVQVDVVPPTEPDEAYYATLGHHVGELVANDIPVLCGLDPVSVTDDDLKTFGAAFATTSAAPMVHVVGRTPEAATLEQALGGVAPTTRFEVGPADLEVAWRRLGPATERRVDLVALGNPHCSHTELARLSELVSGRRKHRDVSVVVACGREVHELAEARGHLGALRSFGATFLNDTCWCLVDEPVVPASARTVLTSSGKYAHYGPGITGLDFHVRGLAACVEAACTGSVTVEPPAWLT